MEYVVVGMALSHEAEWILDFTMVSVEQEDAVAQFGTTAKYDGTFWEPMHRAAEAFTAYHRDGTLAHPDSSFQG